MALEVKYKFEIGSRVITPLGVEGIVSIAGTDKGGNHFYVKTATGSDWYDEDQLTAA